MPNRLFLLTALAAGAFLNPYANAQAPSAVLITGLCSTGVTPKSAQPRGCLTSTLITPINPESGRPIVDRNWDLAFPYPSAPGTQPAPNPCDFTAAYRPVPVSATYYGWYNPADGISQWIEPEGGSDGVAPGWYLYRTGFSIPAAQLDDPLYRLDVTGQFLADDYVSAIYLADPSSSEQGCREVASFSSSGDEGSWQPFKFGATVLPATRVYLYFVVFNANTYSNPTGLRVEFFNPSVSPY